VKTIEELEREYAASTTEIARLCQERDAAREEVKALREIIKSGAYLAPLRFHTATAGGMRVNDSWIWHSVPWDLWDMENEPAEYDTPDAAIDAAVKAVKGDQCKDQTSSD
jgi:hypothetical protein